MSRAFNLSQQQKLPRLRERLSLQPIEIHPPDMPLASHLKLCLPACTFRGANVATSCLHEIENFERDFARARVCVGGTL